MKKTKLNESIRIAKEGIGECWDDMADTTGQMPDGQSGGPMSVTINMPGKNISVTTDSADEIANILKLAGIQIGGMSAEAPAAMPSAEMPSSEEPAVMYVGAEPTVPSGQVPGDVDGDGDHDMSDHEAEEDESDEDESEEDDEKKMGEGWEDMVKANKERAGVQPNGDAGVKQGTRYGGGRQDDKAADDKKEVKEDDLDENAYNQAAAAASREGKGEFEFPVGSGKMHPVKMDSGTAHQMAETARMLQLAGVTNEAQSAAQKAAFAKMIAAKGGNKSDDKSDKKDDNKKPDADGDGVPDYADKDKEVKEQAPATNSMFGQGVYEQSYARILELAGLEESKLMNSPAGTSMDEPKLFDSLPSNKGDGAGNKAFGANRANGQGENPMGLEESTLEQKFADAMGEYRKFVAESISRKK